MVGKKDVSEATQMEKPKAVAGFDEVPVSLTRASDKSQAALEDALVGLADAQEQLREAKLIYKSALKARTAALMGGGAHRLP